MYKCNSLPEEINGFKIKKDLGSFLKGKTKKRRAIVICKVCKKEFEIVIEVLKRRKSCGCITDGIIISKYSKTHPRLVRIYRKMIERCYSKNDISYHLYGKKGIKVSSEWRNKKYKFCEWSLQNGYRNDLTLDRIDNNKDYSPDNCRWVTFSQQSRNRKGIKLNMEIAREIRKEKENFSVINLSKKYNVGKTTIYKIINNEIWKE